MTITELSRPRRRRTIRSLVPILAWLPGYRLSALRLDVLAGLTVWALLVPEAMAYAGIAGMPPESGLYAVSLALAAYAVFGTSRHLHVGPSSTVAATSFGVVAVFAAAGTDAFVSYSIILAVLVGALLILAGWLRLGLLADFISRPVLDGFVVGVAVSIVVGQLDKLLGFEPEHRDFVPEAMAFVFNLRDTHGLTLAVGLACLAALLLLHRSVPKVPASLAVLAAAIVVSYVLDLEAHGVHIVGEIPAGLPDYGWPDGMSIVTTLELLPGAVAVALVAFAESIAIARSYATEFHAKIDADQELIALGAANLGAGLSGAFAVNGSMSRTAAAVGAGARAQMVSLVVAVAVLLTAAFLTPLFHYLPEATLAAIVIHAVLHLINVRRVSKYRSITTIDFWTAVAAVVGVLALGILEGLVVAVLLGLLGLLWGAKTKTTHVLGRVPGATEYRTLEHFGDGETYPGLLIVRFDGSLFFANAPDFAEEIRAGVAQPDLRPSVVLVDAESVNNVDATAVMTLAELEQELQRLGVDLRFARVKAHVMEVMRRAGIEETVEPEHFYDTVQDGVDAFLAAQEPPAPAATLPDDG